MGQCGSVASLRVSSPPESCIDLHEAAPYDTPMGPDSKLRTDADVEDVYHLGPALGYGGFSKVRLATHRETRKKYAAKIIPLPPRGSATNKYNSSRAMILREVDVIQRLDHPCLVKLHEWYVHDGKLYLIMDLLAGGELLDEVEEHGPLTEPQARGIFLQLLLGVQFMHSIGIVHRDLKLENLLLERQGDIASVKIVDFGFAKKCRDSADECLTTVCGTPEYMAPEVVRGSSKIRAMLEGSPTTESDFTPYSAACDLWSCGVILYMLLSGQPPFSSTSHPRLLRSIVAGRFSFEGPAWKRISPEAQDLIAKLLVVDPRQRLTANAALAHPWMKGSRGSTRSARSSGLLQLAKRLARAASSRLSL
ncbi:serine threonine kinase [Chlorella sorokiniana]|uniref:Serine threonine kinase n=1 Tax=Chlorella sorokiniana TaxID=3076 RepID=A0A2P6TTT7_CHLSO|nr:serine threonine kinase [Chlorella sorokiniana]|eukprot:PRW57463.1 serine threonine kinase [Chlorella sorokiniana]